MSLAERESTPLWPCPLPFRGIPSKQQLVPPWKESALTSSCDGRVQTFVTATCSFEKQVFPNDNDEKKA